MAVYYTDTKRSIATRGEEWPGVGAPGWASKPGESPMDTTIRTQISELAASDDHPEVGLTDETGETVTVIDEFDWEVNER